jgi:UDP-glucuronate decarboxylase
LAHRPLPQDDPQRRRPVIARAADSLGWKPKVSLEQGLDATIAYFALSIATDREATVASIDAARAVRARASKRHAISGQQEI